MKYAIMALARLSKSFCSMQSHVISFRRTVSEEFVRERAV